MRDILGGSQPLLDVEECVLSTAGRSVERKLVDAEVLGDRA
jgi:hypothetical protein